MFRAVHLLPLLLALGLPILPPAAARNPLPLPTPSVPGSLGVNIHFTDPQPGEMELLAKGGFKWVRMDFAWSGIEKTKGSYDFSAYDRLLARLKKENIRLLAILDYGNDLYSPDSPRTPEARAAFARFVTASVTHFKGRGILWEMWNEPNIGFWKPTPNVADYVRLARATGQALRKAAPDEYYIGPGVSGMDFDFMETCFKGGLLEYWDAVSFHPYRGDNPPETAADEFRRVRQLIAMYGPKGKTIPLISSEWGYSELYSGMNREKQAKFISREYLSNMANGLLLSIWYDWRDDGPDPKEAEHHFGTVLLDFTPKTTYRAVQALARALDGYTFNKRLALDSPDDYLLLFTKNGAPPRLAAWTVSATPHAVTLPASAGAFTVTDNAGQQTQATATRSGLNVTLTDAPQYFAPHSPNALLSQAARWGALPPSLSVADADDLNAVLQTVTGGTRPEGGRPQGRLTVKPLKRPADWPGAWNWPNAALSATSPSARLSIPPITYRGEEPFTVRATLAVPGALTPLAQETRVTVTSPLRLTPLAPSGGRLQVRVENPSGEPFAGRVRLLGGGATEPVTLAKGVREKLLSLPVTPQADGSMRAELTLEERRGAVYVPALKIPALSFTSLPDPGCPAEDDGDLKLPAQLDCARVPPPPGLPAPVETVTRVTYKFPVGWKFLRLPATDRAPLSGKPYALGMWLHGDGSGDLLRMRFTDTTGQSFQPDGGTVNFTGWRYVSFPLSAANAGHWGGSNDGMVHGPIHWDTLLLVDSPGGRGGRGTVHITGLTLVRRV